MNDQHLDDSRQEHRGRRIRRRTWLVSSLAVALAASGAAFATYTATNASAASYPNPGAVNGNITVHDPSMVKGTDGVYYLFSTGQGIDIRTSTDRTKFTYAGQVLPNGATWASAYASDVKALWAPDVSYHNGLYYLYYSASSFGSNHSAIGLATSTTAKPGSWTDKGVVYTSNTSKDFNAIDPSLIVDSSGKWWLTLGSFWSGIKMIQIDPSTGKQLASNTTRYSLAQRPSPDAMEAPVIFKHGSYYYLFVSWDYCCKGTSSTYRIMVGRSTSITGTYKDRNGTAMTSGGGTEILATHGSIIGPGGQSVMADSDNDLLVYHYYDGNANGTAKLGINFLGWDSSGWPYVW
ncbi:MAG: arabinan endo-1,5-alpha-L-arabinosidase [Micromonosporaceae bacterium]|nr:arabinan endo-1,5-alpha-L-arabinosidase [Micromonosporaceae bacterium]